MPAVRRAAPLLLLPRLAAGCAAARPPFLSEPTPGTMFHVFARPNRPARVEMSRQAGRPVEIVLYPGAGHVFDSRDSPNSRKSAVDMLAFFGRHLGARAHAR